MDELFEEPPSTLSICVAIAARETLEREPKNHLHRLLLMGKGWEKYMLFQYLCLILSHLNIERYRMTVGIVNNTAIMMAGFQQFQNRSQN